MSNGVVIAVAVAGTGLAVAAIAIAARALKQTKTVEVFEPQPQQPYMLQAEPPSAKVQAMGLPARETEVERVRERQA